MTDKWAVVTGGARNIGQAIGLRLVTDGFRAISLDIVPPEAPPLQADARLVDLSDLKAAEAAFAEVAAVPISVLVNNVGVVRPALFDVVDVEDFDAVMHLNTRTTLIAAKALVPGMRKVGGGADRDEHQPRYPGQRGTQPLQRLKRRSAGDGAELGPRAGRRWDHGELRRAGTDCHQRLLGQ